MVSELRDAALRQQMEKEKQEALELNEDLRSQLAQMEIKLQEAIGQAEHRVLKEKEEHEKTKRELIRSRHEYDCARITTERLEMEHRTKTERNDSCVEQMTQQLEQVSQRNEQQRQRSAELERSSEELQEQVRQLTSQNTALEAQVRQLTSQHSSFEAQASERDRDFQGRLASSTEASRRLEGEKRLMEAELERERQHQKEVEQETRELRCRTAVLEDQLRDSQEQRQRTEQDQQRTEQDLRQWYQKFIESNKENTSLQRANQDHKRDIWELENQLRQERNVANIATPGEFIKLMKAHEGTSVATDNNRLKQALSRTQCDLDLCIRKLHDQEKVIKELQDTLSCGKGTAA